MSISRRQFIQGSLAAGMAGAAGVLGSGSALAARHDPLNEAQADFFKKFDRNVVLLPSKYGGYVQALDLAVPETLAWYNYGLAGVNMPIPHHIAAMPSADPYKGFDSLGRSLQGIRLLPDHAAARDALCQRELPRMARSWRFQDVQDALRR